MKFFEKSENWAYNKKIHTKLTIFQKSSKNQLLSLKIVLQSTIFVKMLKFRRKLGAFKKGFCVLNNFNLKERHVIFSTIFGLKKGLLVVNFYHYPKVVVEIHYIKSLIL